MDMMGVGKSTSFSGYQLLPICQQTRILASLDTVLSSTVGGIAVSAPGLLHPVWNLTWQRDESDMVRLLTLKWEIIKEGLV